MRLNPGSKKLRRCSRRMEEKGRMWRVVEVRGKEEEGLGGNDRRKM